MDSCLRRNDGERLQSLTDVSETPTGVKCMTGLTKCSTWPHRRLSTSPMNASH